MARHLTTERTRRRCRVGGAVFVAAAVLPWVALTPGAQADPGNGQPKVNICHATNSDTNPYTFQEVSAASVDLEGHLAHRTDPVMTWKTDTLWNGVVHAAGSEKPDLIADYDGHVYDGDITAALCDLKGGAPTPPTTVTVTAPPVTTTVTAPPVTTTVTQPAVTTTVTQPAVTETQTVTAPPVTTTVTETQTVTAPPVTTTVTEPGATETVTAPPVTTTVTEPAVTETMTVTALPTTVTITQTPSTTTTDSTTSTTTASTTTSSTTTSTSSQTDGPTVLPTKITNTSDGTTTAAAPSTSDPVEVLGERAALPRTGSNVAKTSALSLLLLTMGVLLLRVSGMRVRRQRKH